MSGEHFLTSIPTLPTLALVTSGGGATDPDRVAMQGRMLAAVNRAIVAARTLVSGNVTEELSGLPLEEWEKASPLERDAALMVARDVVEWETNRPAKEGVSSALHMLFGFHTTVTSSGRRRRGVSERFQRVCN